MNKQKLDTYIDLLEMYYKTHDIELVKHVCDASTEAFGEDDYNWLDDICTGICCSKRFDRETYYKVLEVLGYEIHWD